MTQYRLAAMIPACLAIASCLTGTASGQDAGLAAAEAIENSFVRVIEQAEPSVVSIARDRVRQLRLNDEVPVAGLPQENPNYTPNEFGTGIIVREDGLILTNYHLVRGGPIDAKGAGAASEQVLYVRLADRRGFLARIHAADPRSDLAVLKIDATKLKPIKLPDLSVAKPVRKGQLAIALGNPYAIGRDGSASATWGIISNISRQAYLEGGPSDDPEVLKKQTVHHLGTLLQTDMRLNLGTSGGPLFNLRGELIGITTSLAAIAGYEKSAGFAVPIDEAILRIIDTLIKGEEVEYGFLGINPKEAVADDLKRLAERFNQHGAARVQEVLRNTPASQGGLNFEDLILAVNDKPIYSSTDLMREIGLLAPGSAARLRVVRRSEPQELLLNVIVGKWPVADDEAIVASNRRYKPWRGMAVDFATARKRFLPQPNFRSRDIPLGVLITEVFPNTPATAAELQPGEFITHLNGVPVRNPQQFYNEVNRFKDDDVKLSLASGRQQVTIKAH